MKEDSKNKFALKIVLSYLVLAILVLGVGYFTYAEIKVYLSNESTDSNDIKLLKTSSLLTHIYEAESLSKLAIQTRTTKNFKAYSSKIDSITKEIDTLKLLTDSEYQESLLDSVQLLLRQKVDNNGQLRLLKVKNETNNSLDKVLDEFKKMEATLGTITPEALVPNLQELPTKSQKVIRELATYLNNNVPYDGNEVSDKQEIDSILKASKMLLNQAKLADNKTQRSLERKEFEIHSNELVLSQKLRSIIAAFEQELIVNAYNHTIRRKAIFRRSIRFAGFAAGLGIVIVVIFTFLIKKDYWKIQTYRKKLEKEKKFSESLLKTREQLITTVSHDLRTPLSTISGYSELIENTPLSKKQLSYIKNVKSATSYVESLVNDLLDYSKLDAGKIKRASRPFVFSSLITETAQSIKELYKEKPIALLLKIDKQLETSFIGDPFRLRQIVTNLISNAYKFTHKGTIEIKAEVKKAYSGKYLMTLSIKDSGIGIRKDKQAIIFNEFTQADPTTERKYGGYGLGLAITKKLTDLLEGQIKLESEEGKGSNFTVTIPLQLASQASLSSLKQNFVLNTTRFSILIIDDDTSMLQLLSELCANIGIRAITLSDFKELNETDQIEYDAVLTDIQMPVIDGFEVIKKLQTENYKHYHQQPIIAMTGRRNLEVREYWEAGFVDVLYKPYSKNDLLEVLSTIFPDVFLVKNDQNEAKMSKNGSIMYDLSLISSFLGDNEEAINEVLNTFISATESNIVQLKLAASRTDYEQIQQLAHKMLPMFRQLQIHELITVLEDLEVLDTVRKNPRAVQKKIELIEKGTRVLVTQLNTALVISPNCID